MCKLPKRNRRRRPGVRRRIIRWRIRSKVSEPICIVIVFSVMCFTLENPLVIEIFTIPPLVDDNERNVKHQSGEQLKRNGLMLKQEVMSLADDYPMDDDDDLEASFDEKIESLEPYQEGVSFDPLDDQYQVVGGDDNEAKMSSIFAKFIIPFECIDKY